MSYRCSSCDGAQSNEGWAVKLSVTKAVKSASIIDVDKNSYPLQESGMCVIEVWVKAHESIDGSILPLYLKSVLYYEGLLAHIIGNLGV